MRPTENTLEERSIYIDLSGLALPVSMHSLDERAIAAAHIYERFTPYADDGWEWLIHPADPDFKGWVPRATDATAILAGANLECRRRSPPPSGRRSEPLHGVSLHRARQLTQRPWTGEPGSKIWRKPS